MSSTNRGGSRIANDFYPTPSWLTEAILKRIPVKDVILDPFAGTGDILAVAKHMFPRANLYAVEFDPERAKVCRGVACTQIGDAFKADTGLHPGRVTIITNPPFSLALKSVERCLELADSVAILLPASFSGSAERKPFWEKIRKSQWACDRYDSSRRPSFCKSVRCSDQKECGWSVKIPVDEKAPTTCPECGLNTKTSTSDSQTYSWFHFQKLAHPKSLPGIGCWDTI